MKYRTLKSGDEKRSRLLEIIRKIDIDEDDDLDESELVQERLTKNSISDLSTRFVSYHFSNQVTINYGNLTQWINYVEMRFVYEDSGI